MLEVQPCLSRSLGLLDFCYGFLLVVLGLQIHRKITKGHKYFSKKCLIYYVISIDLACTNFLYQFSVIHHLQLLRGYLPLRDGE